MGEEEGIILTKYTDSNVYSLKKNEITLLKDSIIGVIYIKVSSMKISYKWSKRYLYASKNGLLIYKPKTDKKGSRKRTRRALIRELRYSFRADFRDQGWPVLSGRFI